MSLGEKLSRAFFGERLRDWPPCETDHAHWSAFLATKAGEERLVLRRRYGGSTTFLVFPATRLDRMASALSDALARADRGERPSPGASRGLLAGAKRALVGDTIHDYGIVCEHRRGWTTQESSLALVERSGETELLLRHKTRTAIFGNTTYYGVSLNVGDWLVQILADLG